VPHLEQFGGFQTAAPIVATAERTIRPEAIAFGVFAVVLPCIVAVVLRLRARRAPPPQA